MRRQSKKRNNCLVPQSKKIWNSLLSSKKNKEQNLQMNLEKL